MQLGPDLIKLLQATEKEALKRGDQFIASELFLLALADAKGEAARIAREAGLMRKSLEAAVDAVRGGQGVDSADAELKLFCRISVTTNWEIVAVGEFADDEIKITGRSYILSVSKVRNNTVTISAGFINGNVIF